MHFLWKLVTFSRPLHSSKYCRHWAAQPHLKTDRDFSVEEPEQRI